MNQEKDVLSFIYSNLDALYYFKDEDVNDFSKRAILRYFFILIDDLLKVAGKVNNKFYKSGKISRIKKKQNKNLIKDLNNTFDNEYDVIRDKMSAHQQHLPLDDINKWWVEIDNTTIETLYSEAHAIRDGLKSGFDNEIERIKHYSIMDIFSPALLKSNEKSFNFSAGRLSIARNNTSGILPAHDSQVKAQIISSTLELIQIDFGLTQQCNNPDSDYKLKLFDIGWLLVICDFISLIDNLYEDNSYGKSLLSIWKELDIKGFDLLNEYNIKKRDLNYEDKLREIRNKIAAHKDSELQIATVYKDFMSINLRDFHGYVMLHCNAFKTACSYDNRTKLLGMTGVPLKNIKSLSSSPSKPFNN